MLLARLVRVWPVGARKVDEREDECPWPWLLTWPLDSRRPPPRWMISRVWWPELEEVRLALGFDSVLSGC